MSPRLVGCALVLCVVLAFACGGNTVTNGNSGGSGQGSFTTLDGKEGLQALPTPAESSNRMSSGRMSSMSGLRTPGTP